jgi:hypothetical protein
VTVLIPRAIRALAGSGFSRASFARFLTSCGVTRVNLRSFENSRRRDPDPTGSVHTLTPSDQKLMSQLMAAMPVDAIVSLLASPAMAIGLIPSGSWDVTESTDSPDPPIDAG